MTKNDDPEWLAKAIFLIMKKQNLSLKDITSEQFLRLQGKRKIENNLWTEVALLYHENLSKKFDKIGKFDGNKLFNESQRIWKAYLKDSPKRPYQSRVLDLFKKEVFTFWNYLIRCFFLL